MEHSCLQQLLAPWLLHITTELSYCYSNAGPISVTSYVPNTIPSLCMYIFILSWPVQGYYILRIIRYNDHDMFLQLFQLWTLLYIDAHGMPHTALLLLRLPGCTRSMFVLLAPALVSNISPILPASVPCRMVFHVRLGRAKAPCSIQDNTPILDCLKYWITLTVSLLYSTLQIMSINKIKGCCLLPSG